MDDDTAKRLGDIKLGVIEYRSKLWIVNTEEPGVKAYHYLWDHCYRPLSTSGLKYLTELLQESSCDALEYLQGVFKARRNLSRLDIEIIARLSEISYYGEYKSHDEYIITSGSEPVYNDYPVCARARD